MKEEILKILKKSFCYIYCDNCKFETLIESNCDVCHRKNIEWEPSDKFLEEVTNEILKVIK